MAIALSRFEGESVIIGGQTELMVAFIDSDRAIIRVDDPESTRRYTLEMNEPVSFGPGMRIRLTNITTVSIHGNKARLAFEVSPPLKVRRKERPET